MERITHTIQTLLELDKMISPSDEQKQRVGPRGVLQLDFANAYNTISRKLICTALLRDTAFAGLLTYFDAHYPTVEAVNCPKLAVRMEDGSTAWIASQEGVHQGDPLGPIFFSFGLSEVMLEARTLMGENRWKQAFTAAYLDDIHSVSDVRRLEAVMHAVRVAARRTNSGLILSAPKCKLFVPEGLEQGLFEEVFGRDPQQRPTLVPADQGLLLLGTPVGSDQFVVEAWERLARTRQAPVIEAFCDLEPQQRMLMMRMCGVPLSTFMVRASKSEHTQTACDILDEAMKRALQTFCIHSGEMRDIHSNICTLQRCRSDMAAWGSSRRERGTTFLPIWHLRLQR